MREVFDFKDIRRLEDTVLDGIIREGIVVVATSELEAAMSSYYPQYLVFDVHAFISDIIPGWEKDIKDIKNYVMLRNVIEDYVTDYEVNSTVATYLRRNAADIWNAIKLLIEADVYPDDVDASVSEPVRRFRDIWKKLEIENDQILTFRSTFAYELSQKEKVVEIIRQEVDKQKKAAGKSQDISEDIFLFGFYFITPIQQRIFDTLEDAGFHLKFVNCHDSEYRYANEIWERTFAQEYEDGNVRDIQEDISFINYFGEILKNNKMEMPVQITKHHTEFDFATMVKDAVEKGEIVYSPDAKQCEHILKEYFPECYDQKHLLSYPVGQYIYYLHMMWNTFSNRMDMKYEYVFKCFASGWLNTVGLNGRDYLYEMKLLAPYFKDCHELKEGEKSWKNRLQTLKRSRETVAGFKNREHGDERWHRLLGNPFDNIGVFTVSDETIDDIEKLLDKLIDDAEYLFADSDRTDLFEHFQRITHIIEQHLDEDDLLKEEAEIANELLIQLSDETASGITCPMNGIRDAIVLLIGDHFGEYETQEKETADKKRLVLPLSMVEAGMLNNYGQTVHLVLANEFDLPGKPKKLPWPLTDEVLDSLQIEHREKTRRYVKAMRSVITNRPLSYRYLFYSFMGISNSENKPTLSIEWVCKKDKKEIDVSPYIRLLDVGDNFEDIINSDESFLDIIRDASVSEACGEILPPDQAVPDEVRMDYLLCRTRYAYSYLLNYLPTYSSEFHYSFELSKLISAFSILSGINKDKVTDNIEKLLPFLLHIELRQSVDFASSQGIPEPYMYDGIEYPAQRLLTHYINDEVIRQARSRDEEYLNSGKIPTQVPEKACIYCPYSEICLERYDEQVANYE